jgi:hypothetical protein
MTTDPDAIAVEDLRMVFGLSEQLGHLLRMLVASKLVSTEMVAQADVATHPRIALYRLRNALEPHHISIRSQRDLGYWLDEDTKHRIALICAPVTPEGNE